MRVLLIEDDACIVDLLKQALEREEMRCDTALSAEDGQDLIALSDYDVIILDLMLPDMDGYELVKLLRTKKLGTPILILSGLAESVDKVRGLCVGADDYLTKPFDISELVARLHAIVRRSKGHTQQTIRVGDLTLNLDEQVAFMKDAPLNLTSKEYAILELLAVRKGSTLSKNVFLSHLYNGLDEPELKIVDVFVCKLRKKLAEASNGENYIDTVWGRGYVLREPVGCNNTSPISLAYDEDEIPAPKKQVRAR